MSKPYKKDPVRTINAVAAAALLAFFLVHAALGTAKVCGADLGETFKWTVWAGVAVIVVHVGLSLRTTQTMFTDTERPASAKKRRHQMLKWLTGGVLLLAVLFHFPTAESTNLAIVVALITTAAALAWHAWTGTKSLTRDLNLPLAARTAIRILACVFATALAVVLLIFL